MPDWALALPSSSEDEDAPRAVEEAPRVEDAPLADEEDPGAVDEAPPPKRVRKLLEASRAREGQHERDRVS